MSAFIPIFLSWLQQFGYPVLGIIIFFAAIGIPLPISLLLLGAGAFAAQGDFNIYVFGLIAVTASTCGDSVGYAIGRRWGSSLLIRMENPIRHRVIPQQRITQARIYFIRYGGWAIFLSRFLVSGLGGVTNLMAGADKYPFRKFFAYDLVGELLGACIPLALGYLFSTSWEAIGDVLGAFSGFMLTFLISIVLIYQFIKTMRRIQANRLSKQFEKGKLAEKAAARITGNRERISDDLPL